MRLLLDTCIWGGAIPELRASGHDVLWAVTGSKILETTRFSLLPIVNDASW